jgi:hypothetical protein
MAKLVFPLWALFGLVFYFSNGLRRSNVRRGVISTEDLDPTAPGGPV